MAPHSAPSDDYTQAEIVRTLSRIEKKVDGLGSSHIPRTEWQLWADARDREIKEIKDKLADAESRRPTGLAISALGVSILTAIVLVVQALAK